MNPVFSTRAWEDYGHWQVAGPNTLERVNALIKDCLRSPFGSLGKPEPLRGDLQGWWSRRVTLEDRLVYRVTGKGADQHLEIAQCRFHH